MLHFSVFILEFVTITTIYIQKDHEDNKNGMFREGIASTYSDSTSTILVMLSTYISSQEKCVLGYTFLENVYVQVIS